MVEAFLLGIMFLIVQLPKSPDPVVFVNIYAQVLSVTIAGVAVCRAVVSLITEGYLSGKGRATALVSAMPVSAVLLTCITLPTARRFANTG